MRTNHEAARPANARPLAEKALAARFSELTGLDLDLDGRLPELRPLVLDTINDASLEACLRDIARGDGGELRWTTRPDGTKRPPSMHSVFSSCLAALNNFGAWRLQPEPLSLGNATGFGELRFEEKLHIFRGGRAPNLDSVLWDDSRLIAIESKLCEHLAPGHSARFQESYERVAPHAHESWAGLYALLKREPNHFVYLDAAQLVKHYLGTRTQVAPGRAHAGKQAMLIYFYWEPNDAETQPVLLAHRDEVADLSRRVGDPELPLIALSHRDMWRSWGTADTSVSWVDEHVRQLRQRYDVALAP